MKTFLVGENDAGQRLDKFIQKAVPLLPKNLLYKYIRKKRIKRNGKRAEIHAKLMVGDRLELYVNDEFFEQEKKQEFLSAPPNISVVYEDSRILIVNKPQGLVVHEDNENTPDTLINRVKHYLYQKQEYIPEQEHSFAPALANRIDRNTCGLVLVAKTAAALRVLNEAIKKREIDKQYLCLVVGTPNPKQGRLIHYHVKNPDENLVRIYEHPVDGAKVMKTAYRVLEEKDGLALVEVELETGRTHQIRAHMAWLGTPVLGDGKYGLGRVNRAYGLKQQMLCSCAVTFRFSAETGVLDDLNGKTFRLEHIWFVEKFRNGTLKQQGSDS